MKRSLLNLLCCPRCAGDLYLEADPQLAEIDEGRLQCRSCGERHAVVRGIPRFVADELYTKSFGLQWNRFKRTQLDKFSGLTVSNDRFFKTTKWPQDLSGSVILDAGCGAGRFTQIALDRGATVVAVDMSDAVEANLENNGCDRLHVIQADITHLPLKPGSFDRVFCLGVLQHTPDPRRSFRSLPGYLKPCGSIAIDVYAQREGGFRPHGGLAAYLRRHTTRMDPQRLMNLVVYWVPKLLPIKKFLRHWTPAGRYVNRVIPIIYYLKKHQKLSKAQILEWSILDTYDMYASSIEQPQRIEAVRQWFDDAGLRDVDVRYGPNGINGSAVRSSDRG